MISYAELDLKWGHVSGLVTRNNCDIRVHHHNEILQNPSVDESVANSEGQSTHSQSHHKIVDIFRRRPGPFVLRGFVERLLM